MAILSPTGIEDHPLGTVNPNSIINNNWSILNDYLAGLTRSLANFTTDGASTHVDGTEDTLKTLTMDAGQLGADSAKLSGYLQVVLVGHLISTQRVRLYFGGTAILDTTAINIPTTAALTVRFEIFRVSSSVVRASVTALVEPATTGIPASTYTEITGLTLSAAQTIAIKAIATGTNSAAADVTVKQGKVDFQPALRTA